MKTHANLLIEIGTEELPPKALKKLGMTFQDNLNSLFKDAGINFTKSKYFAAPRRLAVLFTEIEINQKDKIVEKRGPAISQAYDADGKATSAALGWAKGCGIEINQAKTLKTDKGEWLIHESLIKGENIKSLIPDFVNKALNQLPIPKLMRWGNHDTQFVRPVHTVCLMIDDEIIEGTVLGIKSNNIICGHRFMGQTKITLNHADEYETQLKNVGFVIADFETRKMIIKNGVINAADNLNTIADISEELLEEVTSLVEWPVILTAQFEKKFLSVPPEALVHTMKGDQKYFPVYEKNTGKLSPHFIFISNIESKDPAQIIAGNEKVVRPRLSDAEFFFETDKKIKLADRLPKLSSVLFQQQLGSLKEKSERIAALSEKIAEKIGADPKLSYRAGLLSKCDLLTNMVFEFTETQGVMGMHYALHDGENESVALAIKEQYLPKFSGDILPSNLISLSVAIAEKMDTLAGIFGIGQHPKGDKDPFALRRASLGILRIIVEKELPLDLEVITQWAIDLYGDKLSNLKAKEEIIEFMLGRFRAWYQEAGFKVDTIQAVLARRPTYPVDFDKRVKAVTHFRTLEEAESLAAANKRVSNILSKIDIDVTELPKASLYSSLEENRLAAHLVVINDELKPLFDNNDYQSALIKLAELRHNIDEFFDKVMVMDENLEVRANRLRLLNQLRNLFLHIADISLLQ
ncbi:glycine--tRNA ligase subunit beta [Thorsellia kenyensis]|uniref:Glycine--tRNA ligase beta subunit n=1 Tax=Thorsellia kenyensis TaxID=1549888 RepID=A0ABV6CCE7_9GAMM